MFPGTFSAVFVTHLFDRAETADEADEDDEDSRDDEDVGHRHVELVAEQHLDVRLVHHSPYPHTQHQEPARLEKNGSICKFTASDLVLCTVHPVFVVSHVPLGPEPLRKQTADPAAEHNQEVPCMEVNSEAIRLLI